MMPNLSGLVTPRTTARLIGLALLLSLFIVRVPAASAATFTIPCTAGVGDTDALVEALTTAGSNGAADTIVLGEGCAYENAVPFSVQADGGNSLTIEGNGSTLLFAPASGEDGSEVLYIASSSVVEVHDLTISGGLRGLTNDGELTLKDVVLSGNDTVLVNNQFLLAERISVFGNTSGGLVNEGNASVRNSTIHSNSASFGAVQNGLGALIYLFNTTVSNNSSDIINGGAIFNSGSLFADNSIVANNTPNQCLILVTEAEITIRNSLVEDSSCGVVDGVNGNTVGVDPALETPTPGARFLRPLAGSPVIDAGNNNYIPVGVDRDQASRPRILNGTVDMGAYEYGPATALTVQLNLQGRANPPGNAWIANTRVEIRSPFAGAAFVDVAQTSNTFGRIFLTDLFPGSYNLWIKTDRTLAAIVPVVLGAGDNLTGMPQALREGDANDSNGVTIADFSILASAFGTASGGAGYDERADFNGDAAVNISDFSLLAASFAQNGAP